MTGLEGDLFVRLKEACMKQLEGMGETTPQALYRVIDHALTEAERDDYLPLALKLRIREQLFNSFRKLDILQELLDDPFVTEIMINGPDNVFIEQNGKIRKWEKHFESDEKLENIIQQIVSRVNRRVNTATPIVDARLEDGSRVHVVLPPVALNGAVMTIRKFPEAITMEKLVAFGSLSREAADFLKLMVRTRFNIFVSGGTSSGKTTLLNALSGYIPRDERIITIEDSAELQINHIPNIVRMETRDANTEGHGAIDMSMLIKASLRMRPDRIIVGEVRDGSAADMLAAFDTGHDGSLSTGHANSTKDMLTRLESMTLMARDIPLVAVRQQIASAVELLVHLERLPDRSRRIVEIAEVDGMVDGEIKLNPLYVFDREKKILVHVGTIRHRKKLERMGLQGEAV